MRHMPPVLESADFWVEHLTDVPDNLRLLKAFRSHGNASGLEMYLKELAIRDEKAHESRTYLVKDAMTGELAAYFSLRSCLIPISVTKTLFDTIPAIEISNFAVNEDYRAKQRAVNKIGAYAFVNFIRPLAIHASTIIGAKWLCLYALPEMKLIDYYSGLGFTRLDKDRESFVYSPVKPKYDQDCIFMYQNICSE